MTAHTKREQTRNDFVRVWMLEDDKLWDRGYTLYDAAKRIVDSEPSGGNAIAATQSRPARLACEDS